ncbi:MAG: helix-turn-helix domain-containing protein [Bacteroidota bacterium]
MTQNTKDILNFKEVIEILGISKSALYKLTSGNKIPYYKPTNGKLYFKRHEVLDWITNQQNSSHGSTN